MYTKFSPELIARLTLNGFFNATGLEIFDTLDYATNQFCRPKYQLHPHQQDLGICGFNHDYCAIVFPDGQVWLSYNGSLQYHREEVFLPMLKDLGIKEGTLAMKLPELRTEIYSPMAALMRLKDPEHKLLGEHVVLPNPAGAAA